MKFSVLRPGALAALLLLSLGSSLRAQDPQAAANAARQLFDAGQYKDAAAAYAQFLQDYPTAPAVSDAQFRLGYLDFLLGDYDASVATLRKILGPPAPAELQEVASSLIPQALSAKAAKMPAGPPRLAAFEEAIKQCDGYLQKYPQGDDAESVRYTRALASYQSEKFDDAAAALRQNLAQFPQSESISDSIYLLALTLSTQGNLAIRNPEAAVKESAAAKFSEAERLLVEIIRSKKDVALANDATYQLGEVYYDQAPFATKEAQAGLLQKATTAYRLVQRKEAMIAAQQARLENVRKRMQGSAGNLKLLRQLQTLQRNEQTKLSQVQAKPSQVVDANLKIGAIFFLQNKPDEARVMMRDMQPFASTEDQQKQIAYYLTMSYAAQNQVAPAVAAYDAFQAKYKGDPLAENLPFVIGTLFLAPNPVTNNPEKALSYLKEALTIYPQSRFAKDILAAQASALSQLKRYDEAAGTYQQFLATNPPPEQAAAAEAGLADTYRNTGKIDEAIAQFKKVRDQYPTTPYAEQAAFYIGQLTLQKGDAKGGLAELDTFLQKYPQSVLVPTAKFTQATAQLGLGQKAAALALFQSVAKDYPKSEVAPFAYFQMATIYGSQQQGEQMLATMREFIAKYPESDKLFFAYDSIGQTQVAAGQLPEAIATYHSMLQQQPKNPSADAALLKAADLQRQLAESLGRYQAQNEDQRKQWKSALEGSIADAEKLLHDYAESPNTVFALQTLLKDQKLLVEAGQKQAADVETYFTQLASTSANEAVKSKTLFALASYLYATDPAKALGQMKAAYQEKLVYAPADLDLYGTALVENGALEEATQIYTKLAADYPNPPGVPPGKAPSQVQEAQSIALYGLGSALQKAGKITEAAQKFDQLKTLYPWSPKLLQATYGLALNEMQEKKYDDALPKLLAIIRAVNAPIDLRANANLLSAKIQEEKGNLESAIDQYAKIATFYEGVPQAGSEGLWKAGQLLEQQAASLDDPPKKAAQLAKAAKYYQQLADHFPTNPHAAEAKQKAAQLAPAK